MWLRHVEERFAGVQCVSKPSILQLYGTLDDPEPFGEVFLKAYPAKVGIAHTSITKLMKTAAASDPAYAIILSRSALPSACYSYIRVSSVSKISILAYSL